MRTTAEIVIPGNPATPGNISIRRPSRTKRDQVEAEIVDRKSSLLSMSRFSPRANRSSSYIINFVTTHRVPDQPSNGNTTF
jgi:hypothetical protein